MGTPYTLKEFFLYESEDIDEAPSKYGDSDMADMDFSVADEPKKRPDLPEPKGQDLEKEDPAHDDYYKILGKMLFAAQQRDSAKDPSSKAAWRSRRRKLTTKFDQLAAKYGLPTVAQMHIDAAKELGKD